MFGRVLKIVCKLLNKPVNKDSKVMKMMNESSVLRCWRS